MSVRTILILGLALVFGTTCAILVHRLVAKEPDGPRTPTVPVVVVTQDVATAATVQRDQLAIQDRPENDVPDDALHNLDDAVDRVALGALYKGDVVREKRLAPRDAGKGLGASIPPGFRAFTITTPTESANLAGFILPGNFVDVLLTMNARSDDGTGGASTTTLLQNVKVLAVEQKTDVGPDNKGNQKSQSVTVLVTPQQALQLSLGQNRGTLHLSLRSSKDTQDAKTRPATLSGLQFFQGKPFIDQAKELMALLPKFNAPPPPAKPEKKAPRPAGRPQAQPDDDGPQWLEIRTLRGRTNGVVQVEPLQGNEER